MNSLLLFFIIVFVFFILLLVAYLIYFKVEQPYCGGNLDSSKLLCNKEDEKTCNPKDDIIYYKDIGKSLQYIFRLYNQQNLILTTGDTNEYTIQKGVFFFGIPDILRALPTDFGQNSLSPYGFISFLPLYPSCISSKTNFCSQLFETTKTSLVNSAAQLECVNFLNELSSKAGPCKFPVNDNNQNLYIQNNVFFNEIGMLGAFSLYENQCVILRFKIPQSQLNLLYWSFNFYIADSLGRSNICSPTYQAIVGSLTHSLNLFHVAAKSKTRKNPFKDDFDFVILVSYNDVVTKKVQNLISTATDLQDIDMVHVFKVPTKKGSLQISDKLPNPNLLDKKTRLFNPETNRLTVLLRLTPRAEHDEELLNNFIYQKDRNDFQVNLIKFNNITDTKTYDFVPNPIQLNAPVNEFDIFGKDFRSINNRLVSNLKLSLYNVKQLNVRNSLLNITAPLYKNLLKTNVPYKGGYQAVQLAGNMQGDNPDAQYRIGQSVCILNESSVLMTFGLNHQSFQNCMFNSYNVTDSIKAYGYEAFLPDTTSTYILYLIGRSKETLNYLSKQIKNILYKNFKETTVQVQTCVVRTGTTQEFAIPYCHPMLNVERIYLNPSYNSIEDEKKMYSIWKIFGNSLNEFNTENLTEDEWNSLTNITAPKVDHFIKPFMYEIEQNENNILVITLSVIIAILFVTILTVGIILIMKKRKQRRKKNYNSYDRKS